MLRRTAKKRTADIDADRWSRVAHLFERGEVPIENTPCRLLGDGPGEAIPDCFVYLTDRAVMLCTPKQAMRVDISTITHARSEQGDGGLQLVIEANIAGDLTKFVFDVYPSPISAAMINRLLSALHNNAPEDPV